MIRPSDELKPLIHIHPDDMRIEKCIRLARLYCNHGWLQGQLAATYTGDDCRENYIFACKWCLSGAILRATWMIANSRAYKHQPYLYRVATARILYEEVVKALSLITKKGPVTDNMFVSNGRCFHVSKALILHDQWLLKWNDDLFTKKHHIIDHLTLIANKLKERRLAA